MKNFKIEFSLALIPVLAVITSALLGAIIIFSFFSSINIANSQSFRQSSPSPSPLQSQQPLQQQQNPLNTNGIGITRNLNEQQMFHQPFAISLQSSPFRSPLSQQQQNQPQQQEQQQQHPNTNGTDDSHKPDNHLPIMASLLPFSKFPQPMCYFNMNPLFCPHYLWVLK
ncbi:MAG: hypothetical protein WCA39_14655 [Nitrososphaeraceae archaeon]